MSDQDNLARLAEGKHADPFSLLGPHTVDGSRVATCFVPGATRVAAVDSQGKQIRRARRMHNAGIYRAEIGDADYRWRVHWPDGVVSEFDDPYALPSALGELDLHLLGEGQHERIFDVMGATHMTHSGIKGTRFCVWAPNANRVSVIGDWNQWDGRRHSMRLHPGIGVWEMFIPGVDVGARYKFELLDAHGELLPLKTDPYGNAFESPPHNAAIVTSSEHIWHDTEWMSNRQPADMGAPQSIYEVHLGSWRRAEGDRWLSYRELADTLVPYVAEQGFTHIELLPVTEHPFDGSWGYQPIGLFAPTWRFGTPDDFRFFVDRCHQAGIGVIVDWVPAHFPRDDHGLARFDGTALYEHEDPRKGAHADWGTLIFNYGRTEVVNYLIGSALYWIHEFHIDALRVDAVASMLYLDYSREAGEWVPNEHGGNENLEAVAFLKRLNEQVHAAGGATYAEESTAWPGVSKPTYDGGLGFTFKWNMGWMNDSLRYMGEDPVHRRYHHDKLTFGLVYAFDENFVLPLSHDEVVHGKRSILGRMPGDDWQRFANLRAYLGFMFAHPGKKLLFMGTEFAQNDEWSHERSLDWHLLEHAPHQGVQRLVKNLNQTLTHVPALHQRDFDASGFRWLDWQDADHSIFAWVRYGHDGHHAVCITNMTPVVREGYRVGAPQWGHYELALNTDAASYGGSDVGPAHSTMTEPTPWHELEQSLVVTLPPLATLILTPTQVG